MTDSPTVSVQLTAYNAERYITETVESILAQTFTDFELVAVDDGSTDGTRAILERFARSDPRVRVISRPNTGIVGARNDALLASRGELLAVIDHDDVAMPERLERQVAYMREHPDRVYVGSWIVFIDSEGRPIALDHVGPDDDAALQDQALSGACPLCHCSVMMRADAVRAVGGYREEFATAEDHDLLLRMGEVGRLGNIQEPLAKFRLHDRSASARQQWIQAERLRRASEEACARRGLPSRLVPRQPWRPFDRASRQRFQLHCGWCGYMQGDRQMALEYGLKAVRLMPWRPDGWRLLACTLLKPPVPGPIPKPEWTPAPAPDPAPAAGAVRRPVALDVADARGAR